VRRAFGKAHLDRWLLGLAAAGLIAQSAAAQVMLRGRTTPWPAEILALGPGGLTVRGASGDEPRTLTWDRVRGVDAAHAEAAARFLVQGEAIWRGARRIDRRDFILAQRALEPVYASGRPEGPTGARLAEAVLIVRLESGHSAGAFGAWLDWIAVGPDAQRVAWRDADGWLREGLIDPGTGLVPRLAPVFSALAGPVTLAAVRSGVDWDRLMSTPAAGIAGRLKLAAEFESDPKRGDRAVEALPADASAGLKLVHLLVESRVGAPELRSAARKQLSAMIRGLASGSAEADGESTGEWPAWAEAWARVGLGRSLLREAESESKRAGVLELLHVPSRFGVSLPELSGLALTEASATLRELGDSAAAVALENELRYSGGRDLLTGQDPPRGGILAPSAGGPGETKRP
jgi:hypothetical protein